MAQIFISYSRKDRDFRERLDKALVKNGYKTWVDENDIPAGTVWDEAVENALNLCPLMLLVITPTSMASREVKNEWTLFIDKDKPIIPILLEPAELNFRIRNLQYIDFHKQTFDMALTKLLSEIKGKGIYPILVSKDELSTELNKHPNYKPANIYWLCHDMMELIRWLYDGITKQWIDVGFRQVLHHAIKIGLDEGIISKLQSLISQTSDFTDADWTKEKRAQYAHEVRIVFNVTAQYLQSLDPQFDPGPG